MGSCKHSSNRLYLTSRRQQSSCGHGHRSQGRVRSIQKRASVEGQGCLLTLHWRNGPSCPESAPTHRPHFSHLNVVPENSQGYDKYIQRALWLCVIHSTERFSLAAEGHERCDSSARRCIRASHGSVTGEADTCPLRGTGRFEKKMSQKLSVSLPTPRRVHILKGQFPTNQTEFEGSLGPGKFISVLRFREPVRSILSTEVA